MADVAPVTPWLYWSLFPIHRSFLRLYFSSIAIAGLENLPAQGPLVIACKHFSRWDPLILSLLSTDPLRFMTNANQFEGIQGWFIQRLGGFPVNLARPSVSSLRHAIALIHQGRKLVIFPEGGIVRDQPLRSFKPGLARLVLQAEALSSQELSIPIVPIVLHYAPIASPRAKVSVQINEPLFTKQFQSEGKQAAQALTNALHTSILKGLKALEN
jgi:1-acyl-sn-glycerol-3-phosphate acyltransferase